MTFLLPPGIGGLSHWYKRISLKRMENAIVSCCTEKYISQLKRKSFEPRNNSNLNTVIFLRPFKAFTYIGQSAETFHLEKIIFKKNNWPRNLRAPLLKLLERNWIQLPRQMDKETKFCRMVIS